MKILIAEDDENSRIYLERALTSQKYLVESAGNGVSAFEKAVLSPPDMVISDILMPEMNGFDLCRKIKANEQLQQIPFIFYSATFIDKKDEELAMSLGASRFIVKPIEMQEFFKIINEVIEEHKEKKLPVPGKTMMEGEEIDEMYSETITRKLDKKVTQLQKEITERKQMEEALRKSETRYQRLYESMTDCFVQVAMSGEILDANRSYLDMLGYTEEEMRKLRYQDITPAKWHEMEQKIIETQVMAQGYSDVYEKEYIRKDGTVFPVELRTYLLRNTDGTPSGMWAIIRDITMRKQTEEELKEYREHLEELVKERTAELNKKNEELERFNRLFVGRELRMIELKKTIQELETKIVELETKIAAIFPNME
jgi:PAS domain S-box-containing protein